VKVTEFTLGMRVKRRSNEGCFVKDRNCNPGLKGRKIGIVVSLPETITPRHKAVLVQWEGSYSAPDRVFIHRLEALPKPQQPISLGGKWERPAAAA
jgi:hypothetical protein